MKQDYFNNYPTNKVVRPERSCPTENLPGWPSMQSLPEFIDDKNQDGNEWLENACRFIENGYEQNVKWNDSLFPSENSWNHLDRNWAYSINPYINKWGDKRLVQLNSQFKMKTNCLLSIGSSALVKQSCDLLINMKKAYPNDMPPGFKEYISPKFIIKF